MNGREREVALDAIEALLQQARHARSCSGDTRDTCTCSYFTACEKALAAVIALQGVPSYWPDSPVSVVQRDGTVVHVPVLGR